MPLLTGQVLCNRYRVEELLGQGGYGAVYKAWDQNLERPCAIKENFDTSDHAQRQFKREAQILYDLSHPNLPKVIDHFVIPEQGQYLVMEFIDGRDLNQMLRDGPLPEEKVFSWIMQVCDALSYMHRQDPPVIHRDVKPANIKITPGGKAMLVDFGISKVFDSDRPTTMAARAVTPGFSPPEQYGRGNTDARSDIFALGATMYTLLTGVTPHDSVDTLTGAAPDAGPARKLNPRISQTVSACIQKAMELRPESRWQSVNEFAQALSDLTEKISQPERTTTIRSIEKGTEIELILDDDVVMQFNLIPAGVFYMGSGEDDEKNQLHRVYMDEYWIGKYPVTNAQFMTFLSLSGYKFTPQYYKPDEIPVDWDDHPVTYVTWYDAMAFCAWLSQESGYAIRLPTEAEWEKAARGTDERSYPWGNEKPNEEFCSSSREGTTKVGSYSPLGDSPYGIADMVGNVWEWCSDWYDDHEYARRLGGDVIENPTGPSSGLFKVFRGGSQMDGNREVFHRNRYYPTLRFANNGFRCVLTRG